MAPSTGNWCILWLAARHGAKAWISHKVFWTISPYEWSFPYHQWLLDEMAKQLWSRRHLAVPESLHVTHVLLQTVQGQGNSPFFEFRVLAQTLSCVCVALFCGRSAGWQGEDDQGPRPMAGARQWTFLRLEFQDGTRKAPTQDYHGSGRPHVRVLVFASSAAMQAMRLPDSLPATMPALIDPEDILPGLVEGSQLDRSGRSGWPIETGPNQWDVETGALRLQHILLRTNGEVSVRTSWT